MQIISVHIPKTAGTAFWNILSQVYPEGLSYRDSGNGSAAAEELASKNIEVVHTHFSVTKYLDYCAGAKVITWLRNPIYRLISDYFFAIAYNDRNNPIHVMTNDRKLTFEQYIELKENQNVMSNFLNGINLEEIFFVGLQEFFEEDIYSLGRLLNWSPEFCIKNSNKNPNKNYLNGVKNIMSNPSVLEKLMDLNKKDVALYNQAANMRAERLSTPPLLQSTIAEWHRFSSFLEINTLESVNESLITVAK